MLNKENSQGEIKKKTILIIEDDISIAQLQRDYMEINGLEVVLCHDGFKAMELVENLTYDLVILDIMLPGLDGLTILKKIRQLSDLPVLLVSAKKEEIDKIKGLGLGADDYITKPFSPSELVARVQSNLSRYERILNRYANNKIDKIISAGPLAIDLEARTVKIGQEQILLAQKEYELLVFLAKNPNRVFSRDELFERIWEMDSLGDSSTVTVHIGRIREKISQASNDTSLIETVWGAGYKLNK